MIKKKIVCVAVLLFAVFCCTTKPLSAKTRYIQLNQWHKVASLNNVKKIHYNKKKLKISKSRIKANSCGTYIISGKKKKKKYKLRIFVLPNNGKTRNAYWRNKTEYKNADYKHLSNHMFMTCLSTFDETSEQEYNLIHIILSKPEYFSVQYAGNRYGHPEEKTSDVCKQTKSILATNASYFCFNGYPAGKIHMQNGVIQKSGFSTGREVCIMKSGRIYSPPAGVSAERLQQMGVRDILNTADPILFQNGIRQNLNYDYSYPRTCLAMKSPLEYYIVVCGSGGYKNGMTYTQLQDLLRSKGVTFARCLDGGGSSTLAIRGELINIPACWEERPVVDYLLFK